LHQPLSALPAALLLESIGLCLRLHTVFGGVLPQKALPMSLSSRRPAVATPFPAWLAAAAALSAALMAFVAAAEEAVTTP